MRQHDLGRLGHMEWLARSALSRMGAVPPGPPSGPQVVPFDVSTGPITVLAPIVPNSGLYRASVRITTPFDGAGATLALGTATDPTLIFEPTDVALGVAMQVDATSLYSFYSADQLRLLLSLAGSTVGAGMLLFSLDTY